MSYLMESGDEAGRLEQKTNAEEVRRRLRLVGIRPGARCLDAGSGTGAIARVMAEEVGSTGAVVAFDASAERLAHGEKLACETGLKNLSFKQGDLYDPPFEKASFDFVWCEFVFEYLSEPDRVLEKLAALVAPGGTLVVGDLDGNAIFHDPVTPSFSERLDTLIASLKGSFDPHAGRQLFARFRRGGLDVAKVQVLPYHLDPGSISKHERINWEGKFKTLRTRGEPALGGAAKYDAFVDEFMALLDSPDTLTYSVLFLVSWTRPAKG